MNLRQEEMDRILVYFRTSKNAHGWVNHGVFIDKMNKFTKNPIAKMELIRSLRVMANNIEKDYPGYLENTK